MKLKYRILSRLGIWATGIHENGECVDWYVRQTIIRRIINKIRDWFLRRGMWEMEEGDLPDFRYLD